MTTGGRDFVGRERELDAILDAAGRAAAGGSVSLLVEGSSGVGVTRLIDEALHRLPDGVASAGRPPVILRGDELPAWRASPYAPFRTALDGLLAAVEPDEATRLLGSGLELLLPLLPGTAATLGIVPARPTVRELLPDRIREAVRAVVGRLAADRLVVVVVEDLHVLDAASRSLIAFLGRTLGGKAVLLIGAYQPEALGPGHPLRTTLGEIGSGPLPAERLAVPPLDRSALRTLIAAREGQAPSAPTLLLVAERSAGSPLLAEEVLAARRELSGASLSMPLDQLVVARAAHRSPECRRLLRILAAAGGPLAPDEIAAVAAAYDAEIGRPAPRSPDRRPRRDTSAVDELRGAAEEAIEHGFVERVATASDASGAWARSTAGRRGGHPLRVRHELLATALAADLLPGSRRRMHAALGAVLEERRPADAGRHAHRAHDLARERACSIDAASAAEAVGAAADALGHLERAIELAGARFEGRTMTPQEEPRLLVRAADAAETAGNAGRAEAFLELALAHLPDPTDRIAVAELTSRLGSARLAGGDRDGALASFERALEMLPPQPSELQARLLATCAQLRMVDGAFTEAADLAAAAVDVASAAGPAARPWLGHATCTLGVVNGLVGRAEEAVGQLETALAIAVESGRLEDAFRARANMTTMLDLQGRREEALDVALRGVAAAESAGLEVVHGNLLRGNAADFLVSLGRWKEARALAERALEWAPSGIPFVNAALGLAVVETETRAGDEAAVLLGRMLLELETVPDVQFAVPLYHAAASLALWRGDLADATRAIDEAWRRVRGSEYWALAARTAAAALAVAEARARASAERKDLAGLATTRSWANGILHEAGRLVDEAQAPRESWVRREVEADLATARAYSARLRGTDGPATWTEVAELWRAVQRPYETARALHRAAEAHLRAGEASRNQDRRGDARQPLLAAIAIATDLEALPLLRALADLAARARIPLPDGALRLLEAAASDGTSDSRPAAGARRPRAAVGSPPGGDVTTAASFGLSTRERGVLAEIVAGRTNRQIGERLFISDKTVGVHVGNILAKLGVSGRVEAAMVAVRLGLVDDLVANAAKPGPIGPGSGGARRRRGAA